MAFESGIEKNTPVENDALFLLRQDLEKLLAQHSPLSQEAFNKRAEEISRSCVLVRVVEEVPFLPLISDLKITGDDDHLFSDIMQTILSAPILRDVSHGAGFIADKNLIVTNYHVIRPNTESRTDSSPPVSFYVNFSSQSKDNAIPMYVSRSARIVSVDAAHDLAVLEFDGETPFPPLPIADSDTVSEGKSVIAMKNHWVNTYAASPAAIIGVDIDREIRGSDRRVIKNLISIATLSVQEGDSGSPLVDTEGRVVGVMTASEGQNMGFAVPARDVRALLTEAQEVRMRRTESEQAPVPTEMPLEIPVTQH